MRSKPSNESLGLSLQLISLLVVILIFFLNMESKTVGSLILVFSSLIGIREIIKCVRNSPSSAIANGNVWVLVSIFIIFLVSPLVRQITNAQLPLVFAVRDTETNMNQVNLLASVAILSLIFGSRIYLQTHNQKSPRRNSFTIENLRISILVSICLFMFWMSLYFFWAYSQGNPFTAIFGSRNLQISQGVIKKNGYLVDSIYGAFGVISAWLAFSVRENKPKVKKMLLSICLILTIPSLLQGDRSKNVFLLLVIYVILIGWNKKAKKSHILIVLTLIPLIVVAPRVYRQNQAQISQIGSTAFSVTNVVETFTKEDTAMAPALAILLNDLGSAIPYQYGKSYLNLVAKPIPRSIWAGKPIEFDTQIMRIVFPNYAASGVGFAFSAISEPLVNFGVFGVVLFFVALGFLNRLNFENLVTGNSTIRIFLNAWTSAFMFVMIRGNLSVDFQRAFFPLASGLIVLYFLYARDKTASPL